MGDIGANRDPAYGISITDFVAIGARDWKSFQLEISHAITLSATSISSPSFTLTELMVTMAVAGILSGIA